MAKRICGFCNAILDESEHGCRTIDNAIACPWTDIEQRRELNAQKAAEPASRLETELLLTILERRPH